MNIIYCLLEKENHITLRCIRIKCKMNESTQSVQHSDWPVLAVRTILQLYSMVTTLQQSTFHICRCMGHVSLRANLSNVVGIMVSKICNENADFIYAFLIGCYNFSSSLLIANLI